MQVKLNAVLMRSDFVFEQEEEPALVSEPKGNKASEEMDKMFDGMETIGGRRTSTR